MDDLIASTRIFFSGARLSYVALFEWIEPTSYVITKIIAPFTYLAFFVLLGVSATGRNTANFYIVGNAIVVAAVGSSLGVSLTVSTERHDGTLVYLILSPANRMAIFFGRAVVNQLEGFLTVVVCLAWGIVLGLDLGRADLAGLALTIVVVTFSATGIGLAIGSVGLITPNVLFVVNTFFFLLLVLSGANVPLEQLPSWVQPVSAILPVTRAVQSARMLVDGASLGVVLPLLGEEIAVGLAYGLAGFAVFRWVESQARKNGSFESF